MRVFLDALAVELRGDLNAGRARANHALDNIENVLAHLGLDGGLALVHGDAGTGLIVRGAGQQAAAIIGDGNIIGIEARP